MFNLLLIPFQEFISAPARIVGLSIICVCSALIFLSKKLTRVIKRETEIELLNCHLKKFWINQFIIDI